MRCRAMRVASARTCCVAAPRLRAQIRACALSATPRCAPLACRVAPTRRAHGGRRPVRVVAIGFGVEGVSNSRVEKRAEALLRAASSLLVFQSALSGEAAQAFLKTLAALRAGRDGGLPALQAYGAFFSKLAAAETTWVDTLLDGVISSSNAFSQAAAKGEQPSAALRAAAASDLEALQQLCVAETTLAAWVRDAADADSDEADGERWLAASAALSKAAAGSSDGAAASAELEAQLRAPGGAAAPRVGPPLTAAQKGAWRDRIGSRSRWRDGVGELAELYRTHGAGLAVDNAVLTWRDGALAAGSAPSPWRPSVDSGMLGEELPSILLAHMSGKAGDNCNGSTIRVWGDAAMASAVAFAAAKAANCRAVALPRSEMKSLAALCEALRAQPRTPFVIVTETLALVPFGEAYLALYATVQHGALPPNVMLLATSRDRSLLRPGESEHKDHSALTLLFDQVWIQVTSDGALF